MELKYDYVPYSNEMLVDLVREMENLSIEELEGIKRCIESDCEVFYPGRGCNTFIKAIHGDAAILVWTKAEYLLRSKRTA